MDDFQGICGLTPYPIIGTVKRVFQQLSMASKAAVMAQIVPGMQMQMQSVQPVGGNTVNRVQVMPQVPTTVGGLMRAMVQPVAPMPAMVPSMMNMAVPAPVPIPNPAVGNIGLNQGILLPGSNTPVQPAAQNVMAGSPAIQNVLKSGLPVMAQSVPLQPSINTPANTALIALNPNMAAANAASRVIAQSNVDAQMIATANGIVPPAIPVPSATGEATPSMANAVPVPVPVPSVSQPSPAQGGPPSVDTLMKVMEENKPVDLLNRAVADGENWSALAGLPPLSPMGRLPIARGPGGRNWDAGGPPPGGQFPGGPPEQESPPGIPRFLGGPPPDQRMPPRQMFRMRNKFVFHGRRPDGLPSHGLITQPVENFRPLARPFENRGRRQFPRGRYQSLFDENRVPQDGFNDREPPGNHEQPGYHGRLDGFQPDTGQGAKESVPDDQSEQPEEPQQIEIDEETYVRIEPENINMVDVTEIRRLPEKKETVNKARPVYGPNGRRILRRRKKPQPASGYTETVYSNMPAPAAVSR